MSEWKEDYTIAEANDQVTAWQKKYFPNKITTFDLALKTLDNKDLIRLMLSRNGFETNTIPQHTEPNTPNDRAN